MLIVRVMGMMSRSKYWSSALLALLVACDDGGSVTADGGRGDDGVSDMAPLDRGQDPDMGTPDRGIDADVRIDRGTLDQGMSDQGMADQAVDSMIDMAADQAVDMLQPDSSPDGALDAGGPDAGEPDGGDSDGSVPDGGAPDQTVPDQGEIDGGEPDMDAPDVGDPDVGDPDQAMRDMQPPDMQPPDLQPPDMAVDMIVDMAPPPEPPTLIAAQARLDARRARLGVSVEAIDANRDITTLVIQLQAAGPQALGPVLRAPLRPDRLGWIATGEIEGLGLDLARVVSAEISIEDATGAASETLRVAVRPPDVVGDGVACDLGGFIVHCQPDSDCAPGGRLAAAPPVCQPLVAACPDPAPLAALGDTPLMPAAPQVASVVCAEGDQSVYRFEAPAAGRYRVSVDAGAVQVRRWCGFPQADRALGCALAVPVDLQAGQVVYLITAGASRLTVEEGAQ